MSGLQQTCDAAMPRYTSRKYRYDGVQIAFLGDRATGCNAIYARPDLVVLSKGNACRTPVGACFTWCIASSGARVPNCLARGPGPRRTAGDHRHDRDCVTARALHAVRAVGSGRELRDVHALGGSWRDQLLRSGCLPFAVPNQPQPGASAFNDA